MNQTPWNYPENSFNYVNLINNKIGIGKIPADKALTRVAIIGAGCAGLCAAYELMKIGLHPCIYESSQNIDGTTRIGGRAYTYRFPGDTNALAELGAMRIPPINEALTYYMNKFGIDYSKQFPDPLIVPTTLYFNGKRHFIPKGGSLPDSVQRASKAWINLINPIINEIHKNWYKPEILNKQWKHYVTQYANKSFFQVLNEYGLTRKEIGLFGSLGLGTGGFDSLYPISFVEILRLAACKWEKDQRIIKGGVSKIPENFWSRMHDCLNWGNNSLESIHQGQPLGRVSQIDTPRNPEDDIAITDACGNIRKYNAVIITCSLRALEMDINVNRRTFSQDAWSAIKNTHMIRSGKVFVRTRSAFWNEKPPESTINCTITDEATRGTYLFDFEDTTSGVICLSYTWEDSSTKFHALSEKKMVEKCVSILKNIYGQDHISNQILESKSFFWEHAKGYNGAFKLNYPGQYEDQEVLFNQSKTMGQEQHNGVFLSGETTSWAGGWIEGAIHSGLDAAMGVVKRMGGTIYQNSK